MSAKIMRQFLEKAPGGWALVRTVECELLAKVPFNPPVLDLGCGNGFFAKILLEARGEKRFDWGLDLSETEIKKAKRSGSYKKAVCSSILDMPFKKGQFSTIISNGTLEHVKGIDRAIAEISRVLKKDGKLIFTVPSFYFSSFLFFKGIPGYANRFNNVFKHYNLFNHEKWESLLSKHGLKVIDYRFYNPRNQVIAHELLALLALPAHLSKLFFGRWILFPGLRRWTLIPEMKICRSLYTNETSRNKGGSLLIVARKK